MSERTTNADRMSTLRRTGAAIATIGAIAFGLTPEAAAAAPKPPLKGLSCNTTAKTAILARNKTDRPINVWKLTSKNVPLYANDGKTLLKWGAKGAIAASKANPMVASMNKDIPDITRIRPDKQVSLPAFCTEIVVQRAPQKLQQASLEMPMDQAPIYVPAPTHELYSQPRRQDLIAALAASALTPITV